MKIYFQDGQILAEGHEGGEPRLATHLVTMTGEIVLVATLDHNNKNRQLIPTGLKISRNREVFSITGERAGFKSRAAATHFTEIKLSDGSIVPANTIEVVKNPFELKLSAHVTIESPRPPPPIIPAPVRTAVVNEYAVTRGQARTPNTEQQNSYFYGAVNLPEAWQVSQGLSDIFSMVYERTAGHSSKSMAAVAVVTPDQKVTVANIGTSPVMLFIRDTTGMVTGLNLHIPSNANPEEKLRVANAVFANKDDLDTSKKPNIFCQDLAEAFANGSEIYLCVASSNLVQGEQKSARAFAELLTQTGFNSQEELYRILAQYAEQSGDLTLTVTQVPANSQTALTLAVFESQDGLETSRLAHRMFNTLIGGLTAIPKVNLQELWRQTIFEYGAWYPALLAKGVPIIRFKDIGLTDKMRDDLCAALNTKKLVPEWRSSVEFKCDTFRLTGAELVGKINDFAQQIIRELEWKQTTKGLRYASISKLNNGAQAAIRNALKTLEISVSQNTAKTGDLCLIVDPTVSPESAAALKEILRAPVTHAKSAPAVPDDSSIAPSADGKPTQDRNLWQRLFGSGRRPSPKAG